MFDCLSFNFMNNETDPFLWTEKGSSGWKMKVGQKCHTMGRDPNDGCGSHNLHHGPSPPRRGGKRALRRPRSRPRCRKLPAPGIRTGEEVPMTPPLSAMLYSPVIGLQILVSRDMRKDVGNLVCGSMCFMEVVGLVNEA